MKVIIIEDEYLMADALEAEILAIDSNISILAKHSTVSEAIEYLSNNPLPDLFFSDIELPDGLSFEIFNTIKSTVPVIFCTAYNEYALEAFKANGIDYILKPFDSQSIKNTITKYKGFTQSGSPITDELKNLIVGISAPRPEKVSSILVHHGEKIIPVKIDEIALVYLDAGVIYAHTFDKKKYSVNYSMDKLEKMLGNNFYRANRQTFVSRNGVNHVTQFFGRKLLVIPKITFHEQIIVSKANATDFLHWLELK